MLSSKLQTLLASLPSRPSRDDILPIAEEIARACHTRVQPRKSLALYLRNAKHAVPPSVLRTLSDLVIEAIDRAASVAPTPPSAVSGVWIDVSEAARVLSLQRATLTDRLKQPEYRYLYGWPHWDGHQWWFSSVALDPSTRVEFLARLPTHEPNAHAALLPSWCVRQPTSAVATKSNSLGV